MSVPDDPTTPTPDEVPDPVLATAPVAEPAPHDVPPDAPTPGEEGTVLPLPRNRASSGVG